MFMSHSSDPDDFDNPDDYINEDEERLEEEEITYWRNLLKKYIAHVAYYEGTDFLEFSTPKSFSTEEKESLKKLIEK